MKGRVIMMSLFVGLSSTSPDVCWQSGRTSRIYCLSKTVKSFPYIYNSLSYTYIYTCVPVAWPALLTLSSPCHAMHAQHMPCTPDMQELLCAASIPSFAA